MPPSRRASASFAQPSIGPDSRIRSVCCGNRRRRILGRVVILARMGRWFTVVLASVVFIGSADARNLRNEGFHIVRTPIFDFPHAALAVRLPAEWFLKLESTESRWAQRSLGGLVTRKQQTICRVEFVQWSWTRFERMGFLQGAKRVRSRSCVTYVKVVTTDSGRAPRHVGDDFDEPGKKEIWICIPFKKAGDIGLGVRASAFRTPAAWRLWLKLSRAGLASPVVAHAPPVDGRARAHGPKPRVAGTCPDYNHNPKRTRNVLGAPVSGGWQSITDSRIVRFDAAAPRPSWLHSSWHARQPPARTTAGNRCRAHPAA